MRDSERILMYLNTLREAGINVPADILAAAERLVDLARKE